MSPRIHLKLFLNGDGIDLDMITQALGLNPSLARKKNDWPQGTIDAGLAVDTWMYQTSCVTSRAVYEQFKELQSIFAGKITILTELIEKFSLSTTVTIVIEMDAGNAPELVIEPEQIRFLSQIHAELAYDLYIND